MAKNEVGEFELVLGNKQLLSVFFIVVILLGVFFTMGYIVGRNSGGVGTLEATNRGKAVDPKPTVIESPSPTQVPAASEPTAGVPAPEPKLPDPIVETPKLDDKKVEEKKAADRKAEERKAAERKAEERKAEEKRAAEDRKAEEKRAADKKKEDKKKAAEPTPAPASNGALSGTYLQLAAVPKAEADLLISVLRKKGFGAAAGPGPKDSNLFRVLVGPLSGADAISATRNSLNDAGMPGSKALVRKF